MKKIGSEIQKVLTLVKTAQKQVQDLRKNPHWMEDARKYAKNQGKEVKRLFAGDVRKVKKFIDRERKEFEKIQKQIPSELAKLRKYLDGQKKEFERLIKKVDISKNGIKVSAKPSTRKTSGTKARKRPVAQNAASAPETTTSSTS